MSLKYEPALEPLHISEEDVSEVAEVEDRDVLITPGSVPSTPDSVLDSLFRVLDTPCLVLDTPCRVLDTHRGVLDSGVLECTPTPCSLLPTPCTLHPGPSTIYLGRPKAARRPALRGGLARLEEEWCAGAFRPRLKRRVHLPPLPRHLRSV